MYCNTNQQFDINAIDVSILKRVEYFKYTGAWIYSSSIITFAGHCPRRDDEVVSDLVLWKSTHVPRR